MGIVTRGLFSSGGGGSGLKPYATDVLITGTAEVGEVLTGSYTYNSDIGEVEGVSTFRWLKDGSPITGEVATTYTIVEADIGSTLVFEVTPVGLSQTGSATKSAPTSTVVPVGSSLLDIDTVVIFGASIMENSFRTGEKELFAEQAFRDNNVVVDVKERATGGNTTAAMVAALPAILTEFSANATKTLFAVHWAGNDITQLGPYPGGTETIDANCRAMCEDIKAAGYKLALSNTTYRIPPASNPTAPYNDNIMDSVISDYADIPMDMYSLTINNQGEWFNPDGIHPSYPVGEEMTRDYVAQTCSRYMVKTDLEVEFVSDMILQFGDNGVYPDGSNATLYSTPSVTIHNLKNTDMSVVLDSQVTTSGMTNMGATGRGNVNDHGDDSISLTNNNGLTSFVYSQTNTMTVDVSLLGIEPAATYIVSVTASRDTTTTRYVDITAGGNTLAMLASASPAEIVTFTNVSGNDLISTGITAAPTGGVGFAYISMIQITKE